MYDALLCNEEWGAETIFSDLTVGCTVNCLTEDLWRSIPASATVSESIAMLAERLRGPSGVALGGVYRRR
jgi:hypothetical protein